MATLTCSVEGCERPHEARGWCKGHYHRWQRHGDPGAEAIGQMTLGRTFWNQLDRSGDCWIWTRANIQGYGVLVVDRKRYRAHRYAYELTYGAIPDGLHVCHHCDNPPCCNPAHLFVGTRADNMADMVRKGRQSRPWAKLRPEDIPLIRSDDRTSAAIARDFGVSPSAIDMVKWRKTWRSVA